ncbi:MAG: hypothetical protein ACXVEK_05955 [Nocardioides sp.]
MPISRRSLLGLGAAVAASAATTACQQQARGPVVATPRDPPTGRPTAPATGPARPPAFAGQPPPGELYFGASLPDVRSLSAWEHTLGTPLALNRSYFTPDSTEAAEVAQRCRDDLDHHRLPHVSTKTPGTWHDVATGGPGDWLSELLRQVGEVPGPVFLTLHHEPENDAGDPGMLPVDFVAMQRRAIAVAADLAPRVTVVPILQHWTFDPLHVGADPAPWIVREASVLGVDCYNAWSPRNGKVWRSLGSRLDEVLPWFGDTPVAIGEYGCREDPANPGLAAAWLADAAAYARHHGVVSMSYFNSGADSLDGTLALRHGTEQAFADLLASDWVARPA